MCTADAYAKQISNTSLLLLLASSALSLENTLDLLLAALDFLLSLARDLTLGLSAVL
jgi:hypothetical protein